jgi:hypothetical protein
VLYPAPVDPKALAMRLNPAAPALDTARAWLLGIDAGWMAASAVVATATMAALLLAWTLYRLALPKIVERIGS